jgi:HD-like signal output (HDOD) protein
MDLPDPAPVVDAAAATPDDEALAQEAAEREAQLQRLLQRMKKHADFPSLKDSIRGIQSVARSEVAHMRTFTDEVMGDVALSNKLLRMINTAFYSSVGGGSIASLSRAVALMGFQPVGMLATSLTLFERLPKGPDGARVQQEFSRALLAALLATQFCPQRQQEENAYITALFQNLGTMLAWMHFPAEATEVEARLAECETPDHAALQTVSRQVLGMGYDDLAIEVVRQWGWPETLQNALRRLEPADPHRAVGRNEYLRVACTAANQLASALVETDGDDAAVARCVAAFAHGQAVPLGLGTEELPAMVERAMAQWAELALVIGFAKPQQAKAAAPAGSKPAARAASPASPESSKPPAAAANSPEVAGALSAALEAVSQMAMSEQPLAEVLQSVVGLLRDAMGLQRVLLCLRDGASGNLVGRLGVGDNATRLAPLFRVPMQPPADLFGLLCSKGADTLISNTEDPLIAQRLPAWFKQQVKAPCFLLLPLMLNGKAVGLIYGDRAQAQSLSVNDNELTLVKALRNQLVMAMRLRGVAG